MKSLRIQLLLVAIIGLTPRLCPAVEIAGVTVNGTKNNAPVLGATVQIVRPGFDRQPTVVLAKAATDSKGRFKTQIANVKKDDLLTARIDWQGFTYEIPAYDGARQLGQFGVEPINPGALKLIIFESTTVAPPLTFTVHHVAISTADRELKCVERIVVENPTSRTYIGTGDKHVTVRLSLPAGAENVELDPKISVAKLIEIDGAYAVTLPITPRIYDNRNAIIINYTLPWKRGGIDLSRKLNYPVRFFFIAREEKDRSLVITAPELSPDENQAIPIDGQQSNRIINKKGPATDGGTVLGADHTISVNVSRPTNPLVWSFVGFLVALCLMVPGVLWRTRTASKPTNNDSLSEGLNITREIGYNSSEPTQKRSVYDPPLHVGAGAQTTGDAAQASMIPSLIPALQECVEAMARLDEKWADGTITRVDYQQQRTSWKSKAMKQWEQAESRAE